MIKAYYTEEERREYTLSLYSAMKTGNLQSIVHYRCLLKMIGRDSMEYLSLLECLRPENTARAASDEETLKEKREEKKNPLKGAVKWYRCKRCENWIPETSSSCPKCGEPFQVAECKEKEIEIIIEVEPIPGAAHIRKKLTIQPKTSPKTIIAKLIEERIINKGEYIEVGIIRGDNDRTAASAVTGERQWKSYADYQPQDIVFFKRQLTDNEIASAYLSYIENNYTDIQMLEECTVSVILPGECPSSPSTREIKVLGCSGREGIVDALGLYCASFEKYPQKRIPFENGTIEMDVPAVELGHCPLRITHFLKSYPYFGDYKILGVEETEQA